MEYEKPEIIDMSECEQGIGTDCSTSGSDYHEP